MYYAGVGGAGGAGGLLDLGQLLCISSLLPSIGLALSKPLCWRLDARPDLAISPPADALHTHSPLFLEGSSQGSPPLLDASASPPQAPRFQRPGRRLSEGSSHSDSSESSDSLAPMGASRSE